MPSDVYLVIADPAAAAVVLRRWLGGGGVRDRCFAVLKRQPDIAEPGTRAWSVSADDAIAIAEAHYVDGAGPEDVRRWAAEFPSLSHWWTVYDDF